MKRRVFSLVSSTLASTLALTLVLIFGLVLAGCPLDGGGYTFTTPAAQREMASLSGGNITATSGSDVFITGRTVTLTSFKMAKYETTYQLWKEVYDWATADARSANKYTFANPGVEGHGTSGTGQSIAGTAAERATRPVTTINWRDAVIWCNAYSELSGKEPVYYTDTTYAAVVRVSTNGSGTATVADGAKIKPGANGYRLPTEAEWEYAARGGNQSDTTSWAYTYAGSNTIAGVAWYAADGAHPVGKKLANGAGLYDMSGNVHEWCWDWSSAISTATPPTGAASGTDRVLHGGSWQQTDAASCAVALRGYSYPAGRGSTRGFRVVCP
jgi:formylglycine-generating enzyme required for sulfatase activity